MKKTAIIPEPVMTSNGTDVKLTPVTKLDKKNTATSKILTTYNDVIVIFQFMANLKQSRIRTLDAWSADISKIKVLVLKGILFEIKSVFVLTYQLSSFKTNPLFPTKIRVKRFQLKDFFSQLTKLANIFEKLAAPSPPEFCWKKTMQNNFTWYLKFHASGPTIFSQVQRSYIYIYIYIYPLNYLFKNF